MSTPSRPLSTHYERRLLLLPSIDSGTCSQTLEMADALRQDGFEVDIADASCELSDYLPKASQTRQPYPAVILGLGLLPTEADIQKLRLIWHYIPNSFIVACAAEFPESWESEARKLAQGEQLFMLDNPVDIHMLRRLAASLFSVSGKCEDMRRKLDRMVNTVSACAHEISRRKEAEEEASRYATVVESTNRALEEFCAATEAATLAKNEFLANMSHEIRTPMTAILGFAEELFEPKLPEKERLAAATTIQRNGQHLLSIINDILDYSKIEAGKMEVEQIECSPKQLLDDVHSLMKEKARRKHLSFEISRLGEVPEIIVSDPTRIRQILINLAGNAIKFTAHGSVKISYGLEEQGDIGPTIFFEVEDTGIGMTDDQIDRLFMPFSQADSSTTRRYGGTGLGLSICKHLVDRLGGHISVHSRFGEGSTFRVVMPFRTPLEQEVADKKTFSTSAEMENKDAAENHSRDTSHASGNKVLLGRQILVAEDAPDNQRLIRMILEKSGSQVEMAGNGLAAVEMAAKAMRNGNSFDLILMDIQMPILDGYQATVQLREEGYTGPIIALTAHAMGSEVEKILAGGCNAYLAKPFTRQGLLSTIAESTQNCEKSQSQ